VMASEDREAEAIAIWREDVEACRRIGAFGAAELPGSRFLTICNAGRLATTGIGTALAPVYAKSDAGESVEVFACETRPLRQGARLTAWELADAGVPVTVLPDGAAGALLASGRVDAVIAGCDRVAANGDVANKIGTFGLAIAARHHGVPFYVLGPRSTLDVATASGSEIEIEQRAASEIAVAAGASVWNPAFDVTPASLVTALITDAGVLREPYGPAIEEAVSGSGAGGS
jgi:methylthioribose-1-phosphate isomerase